MTLLYDFVLTFGEEVRLQSGTKCAILIVIWIGRVCMAAKNEHSKPSSHVQSINLTRTVPRAKFSFYS
jgi:hypothetical protein